jgi:protein SCO1/2
VSIHVANLARCALAALAIGGTVTGFSPVAAAEQLRPQELTRAEAMPEELSAVGVDEHLEALVDPALQFTAHDGRTVTMGELLQGDKPTLLTLNYYTCETLCSVQLNAVLDGLKELDWVPGRDFNAVTVSINPAEGPEVAGPKRAAYLESLGKDGADWSFLTGEQAAIESLAETVGFRYSFDEASGQYAHPAVIAFTSPEGRISRYIYGVSYPAMDLKFALMESAAGRAGSPVEKLVLSCFRYDATVGRYTPWAFGIMRLGGVVTMVLLGILGTVMWRREYVLARADRSKHS